MAGGTLINIAKMITRAFVLLFRLQGWKIVGAIPKEIKKAVVIAAPHTSNWDFVYALAIFRLLKINVRYLAKNELNFFPLNILLRNTGAIFVERSKKLNLTDQVVEKFNTEEELFITFPAEGTRKRVEKWKSGFYYAAVKAGVPILPGYLDFKKRTGGFGPVLYPTGNPEIDLLRLREFYSDKSGKNPELFNLEAIRF